jgi:COP9 signalosome complex subunit 1
MVISYTQYTFPDRALITRLLHISTLLPTSSPHATHFSLAALRRAIPHIKKTWDHALYLRVIHQITLLLHPDPTSSSGGKEEDGSPDFDWIEDVKELERKEGGRLDVELRGYMSNLIKESIRVGAGANLWDNRS